MNKAADPIAAALGQTGVTAVAAEIELPLLDVLRDNPTEFRAANIARLLDDEHHWPALHAALLPINLWRVLEMRRLTQRVRRWRRPPRSATWLPQTTSATLR